MFNETLRIERIARTQGGRYYCKAENGVGVPAIKSIRVDVQCESRSYETLDLTVRVPQGWGSDIMVEEARVLSLGMGS